MKKSQGFTLLESLIALVVLSVGMLGIASLHVSTPHWSVVLRCAIVAVSGSTAHALLYMATMRAAAPKIAPMVR